jgi:hypothetical protein
MLHEFDKLTPKKHRTTKNNPVLAIFLVFFLIFIFLVF